MDRHDHIWVIQRPKTLNEDERGATLNPPRSLCCAPAPPVLEFDADGVLVRSWGGPGAVAPERARALRGPSGQRGLLYVCDRMNNRIQVFKKDGTFVREFVVAPATRGNGSVWDLDVSHDAPQTWLYNADGENSHIWTLLRDNGQIVGKFGRHGRQAGQLHWVHNLAVDSKGNVYTAEVDSGKRAQQFVFKGVGPAEP